MARKSLFAIKYDDEQLFVNARAHELGPRAKYFNFFRYVLFVCDEYVDDDQAESGWNSRRSFISLELFYNTLWELCLSSKQRAK